MNRPTPNDVTIPARVSSSSSPSLSPATLEEGSTARPSASASQSATPKLPLSSSTPSASASPSGSFLLSLNIISTVLLPFLDITSIFRLARTSSTFRSLAINADVWRSLFARDGLLSLVIDHPAFEAYAAFPAPLRELYVDLFMLNKYIRPLRPPPLPTPTASRCLFIPPYPPLITTASLPSSSLCVSCPVSLCDLAFLSREDFRLTNAGLLHQFPDEIRLNVKNVLFADIESEVLHPTYASRLQMPVGERGGFVMQDDSYVIFTDRRLWDEKDLVLKSNPICWRSDSLSTLTVIYLEHTMTRNGSLSRLDPASPRAPIECPLPVSDAVWLGLLLNLLHKERKGLSVDDQVRNILLMRHRGAVHFELCGERRTFVPSCYSHVQMIRELREHFPAAHSADVIGWNALPLTGADYSEGSVVKVSCPTREVLYEARQQGAQRTVEGTVNYSDLLVCRDEVREAQRVLEEYICSNAEGSGPVKLALAIVIVHAKTAGVTRDRVRARRLLTDATRECVQKRDVHRAQRELAALDKALRVQHYQNGKRATV